MEHSNLPLTHKKLAPDPGHTAKRRKPQRRIVFNSCIAIGSVLLALACLLTPDALLAIIKKGFCTEIFIRTLSVIFTLNALLSLFFLWRPRKSLLREALAFIIQSALLCGVLITASSISVHLQRRFLYGATRKPFVIPPQAPFFEESFVGTVDGVQLHTLWIPARSNLTVILFGVSIKSNSIGKQHVRQ